MKRIGAVFAAFLLISTASAAQSLPELFQKAKAQVKGESWAEALKTLDKLDADAALPGNESGPAAARRPDRLLPRSLRGESRPGGQGEGGLRHVSPAPAQRLAGPVHVLQEGDRRIRGRARERRAASRAEHRRSFDVRPVPGVQAAAQLRRAGQRQLGRRSHQVDPDVRGEADLDAADVRGRASGIRRQVLGGPQPAARKSRQSVPHGVRAPRGVRRRELRAGRRDPGQHDRPRNGLRASRPADLRGTEADPHGRRCERGRGALDGGLVRPAQRDDGRGRLGAVREDLVGPGGRHLGQVLGPGDAGDRIVCQLARGLALPQGASPQGRGLPPGRRRLHHEEGVRREHHAARYADPEHARGGGEASREAESATAPAVSPA